MSSRKQQLRERYEDFTRSLDELVGIKKSKSPKLVVVSKRFPAEDVAHLYDQGHRDFGENKVQEMVHKAQDLAGKCPEIRWHLIGHLQRNKAKAALECPGLFAIHSIDSVRLCRELVKRAAALSFKRPIHLFFQMQFIEEKTKGGLQSFDELGEALQEIPLEGPLKPRGLMNIAPLGENEQQRLALANESFSQLRKLADAVKERFPEEVELSMGMSQDMEIALDYGTDWLRIGQAIMGPRPS